MNIKESMTVKEFYELCKENKLEDTDVRIAYQLMVCALQVVDRLRGLVHEEMESDV